MAARAKEPGISATALMALVFTQIHGTSILVLPQVLSRDAGNAAWLALIPAATLGLLTALIGWGLNRRFPKLSFVEAAPRVIGRWPGKILGMLVVAYLFWIASGALNESTNFVVTTLLPDTPERFLAVFFTGLGVYMATLGIGLIGGFSAILIPIDLALFALVNSIALPNAHFDQLLPLTGYHSSGILFGVADAGTWFTEVFIVTAFMLHQSERSTSISPIVLGLGLALFIQLVEVIMSIALFSSTAISSMTYPIFSISRILTVGTFARVDPLVVILWAMIGILKIGLLMYSSGVALAQVLDIRDYRPLLPAVGLITSVLSLSLYPNTPAFDRHVQLGAPLISIAVTLVLPSLILIGAALRNRRHGARQHQT